MTELCNVIGKIIMTMSSRSLWRFAKIEALVKTAKAELGNNR